MGYAWLKADGTEERSKEDVSRAWRKAIMLIVAFDTGQVNFGKHFTQKGKGRRCCEDSISEEARVEVRAVSLYEYVPEKWNMLS